MISNNNVWYLLVNIQGWHPEMQCNDSTCKYGSLTSDSASPLSANVLSVNCCLCCRPPTVSSSLMVRLNTFQVYGNPASRQAIRTVWRLAWHLCTSPETNENIERRLNETPLKSCIISSLCEVCCLSLLTCSSNIYVYVNLGLLHILIRTCAPQPNPLTPTPTCTVILYIYIYIIYYILYVCLNHFASYLTRRQLKRFNKRKHILNNHIQMSVFDRN
jgi:hypothetical protein